MPTAAAGVGQLSRLACIGRSGRRNRLCILRFCGQRQLRAAVVRLACGPTANPALGSSRRAPQSPVSFWCSIYESPCWRAERSRPALHPPPPLPPALSRRKRRHTEAAAHFALGMRCADCDRPLETALEPPHCDNALQGLTPCWRLHGDSQVPPPCAACQPPPSAQVKVVPKASNQTVLFSTS